MSRLARSVRTPAIDSSLATRLLVRPSRREGEGVGGYVLRVAHQNGLRDPRWLMDTAAPRAHSVVRVCPLCLGDASAFWHESWLDEQRPWCDRHRVWLADRCEACGRRLRWAHVSFDRCGCGHDLRQCAATVLTPQTARAVATVPTQVLVWLGALSRHGLIDKPMKRAARRTMTEAADMIELGAAAVGSWPDAFFRLLDAHRLDTPGSEGSPWLVNDALPGLTRHVRKLPDAAWRESIVNALGAYVAASRLTSAPLVGRNEPGLRPPSVMSVAKQLGVRPQRLSAVLNQLPSSVVITRRTAGGRCRRIVLPHAVAAAREALASEITVKPAARLLGLPPARVNRLVAEGRLRVRRGRLERKALQSLRQSFYGAAAAVGSLVDAIGLGDALRCWIPVDRTGQLIHAVETGALTLYSVLQDGASQEFSFSKSELRAWVAATDASALLTIPEAAQRLKLKHQVVYHLVRVGLIATEVKRAGRRLSRVVTADVLRSFERQVEPLAVAARRAGIDHRGALRWAEAQGVDLVSGPGMDGGHQYFVRRN